MAVKPMSPGEYKFTKAFINCFNRCYCGVHHACMSDHIAIGKIESSEFVFSFPEQVNYCVLYFKGFHSGRMIELNSG